jgi:hypothetical protein
MRLRLPDGSNQKAQEIGFYPELYLDASIINAFHEAAKTHTQKHVVVTEPGMYYKKQ